MWTLVNWTLGLIGAYVVFAAIYYAYLRYIGKATRQAARSAALAWPVGVYVLGRRLIGR